jgi:hypothetical protein
MTAESTPVFWLATGVLDHPLNSLSTLLPDHSLDCSNDLVLCCLSAESESGYGDHDYEQRRERKKRVV